VLELVQPERGTGPYKEYFEKHGTGIHHIAFRNDRCDEFSDMLEAEGWPVHDTEDVLGTNLCIKPPKESLHPKG
jgi:4-hydroxyphenylpyruvate dioxygenase-like putative hemolysin